MDGQENGRGEGADWTDHDELCSGHVDFGVPVGLNRDVSPAVLKLRRDHSTSSDSLGTDGIEVSLEVMGLD